MNAINKKPRETPENIFYGVDVNDKDAVQKEFERLKKQHRKVTIIVIVVLIVLAIIFFDFARVNFWGGKPIFAIEEKVENGTLFKGLGYEVLYCDNGEKHLGSVLYKSCSEVDNLTFSNIVYERLVEYYVNNKLMDQNNLESFKVNSLVFDEKNNEGGSDYYLTASYVCKDGSTKCLKTNKEFYDNENIGIYVRIDKYNEIYDVIYFKNSGDYYNLLVEQYKEKIKTYLIDNNKIVVDNLRDFNINISENHGKYKFRDVVYADSYLIQINYLCVDNSNTCVVPFDKEDYEGDYANLSFLSAMFLDAEGNILLMGPKEYLNL